MRVYVVSKISAFTRSTHVLEVFVHEQDAKNCVADVREKDNCDDQYKIDPRELRTGWN